MRWFFSFLKNHRNITRVFKQERRVCFWYSAFLVETVINIIDHLYTSANYYFSHYSFTYLFYSYFLFSLSLSLSLWEMQKQNNSTTFYCSCVLFSLCSHSFVFQFFLFFFSFPAYRFGPLALDTYGAIFLWI